MVVVAIVVAAAVMAVMTAAVIKEKFAGRMLKGHNQFTA